MSRLHPAHMLDKHTLQLQHLRQALPAHFHALFHTGWPLVPNHIDLPENNIHVDPGMPASSRASATRAALSGDFWRYHSAHEELRAHFWTLFYGYCGGGLQEADRRCLETARLVGLFLTHGLQGNVTSAAGSEELLGWDSYGPYSDAATRCQRMRQHCEPWGRSDG